ncbi:unnamed protein product [Musa textilis]
MFILLPSLIFFSNLEGFLINIMSPIKYVKLGGIEFKMPFVLVFTFGLVVILSKTGVEGRRLEENPSDSSLRGVQGKESLVHADNKVVFSCSSAGGSNKEEAKKDINSTPGEKKVKAAADASAGDSFGATKGAENDKMVDVSTMGGNDYSCEAFTKIASCWCFTNLSTMKIICTCSHIWFGHDHL